MKTCKCKVCPKPKSVVDAIIIHAASIGASDFSYLCLPVGSWGDVIDAIRDVMYRSQDRIVSIQVFVTRTQNLPKDTSVEFVPCGVIPPFNAEGFFYVSPV